MKKVLVTGGSGFIGKHFIRLIEKKYDVTNYDIEEGYDIRGPLPFSEFDYVVHFAALKNVDFGERYPQRFIETNCWGTANIVDRNKKARFINISSSAVNDVRSIYGATKQFSEGVVGRLPNALNIRLYNVFGEGQSLKNGGVVAKFINSKLTGDSPVVYGNGSQTRDFTYVGDVVESILRVMESNQTGLVHFGYGGGVSVLDIMQEVFGHIPQYTQKEKRSFEIEHSKSPEKMPVIKYGRAEGIKRMVGSYDTVKS